MYFTKPVFGVCRTPMNSTRPLPLVYVGHLCILHSLFLVSLEYPMYSTQPVSGVCRTLYVFYTACFWCM